MFLFSQFLVFFLYVKYTIETKL